MDSSSARLVPGADGRLLAVGDRVSGTIAKDGRWVEGRVTSILAGARKDIVVVWNEAEAQPRKRSGVNDRFTKKPSPVYSSAPTM